MIAVRSTASALIKSPRTPVEAELAEGWHVTPFRSRHLLPMRGGLIEDGDMVDTGPISLFKYRPINQFLRDILVRHELWFSPFSTFNDPFDCAPIISTQATRQQLKRFQLFLTRKAEPNISRAEARRRRTKLANRQPLKPSLMGTPEGDQMLRDVIMSEIGRTGMFCMSEDPTSILMWSHYADSHRGICLRFHGPSFEADPVVYSKDRPVVNPITNNNSMVRDAVYRKADFWEYEKEWRILSRRATGQIRFDPKALTGIAFGAKISEQDESQVRAWAREGGLSVEWARASLDPREFRMDIHSCA